MIRLERRSGTEQRELEPADQVLAAVRAFAAAVTSGTRPDGHVLRQAELVADIQRLARNTLSAVS